ncbi:MAG: hypothetical protein JWQ23_1220 [Herminiimonas sp.]|nr:hypothetical protein [Herminiimonas sp.]
MSLADAPRVLRRLNWHGYSPCRSCSVFLLLVFLIITPAVHGQAQLRPTNEAALQPDFHAFQVWLQSAIARRDSQALLSIVANDIRNSFGDEDGIANFRSMWTPGKPRSTIWKELGSALALGGSFEGRRFVAPYVHSRWPVEVDPFSNAALIETKVAVHAQPRTGSAVIASLDFAIVPLLEHPSVPQAWTAIRIDGRVGYVRSSQIRSPLSYRAVFERIDDRWQMVAFIAGD